jgi:hypothetical protein
MHTKTNFSTTSKPLFIRRLPFARMLRTQYNMEIKLQTTLHKHFIKNKNPTALQHKKRLILQSDNTDKAAAIKRIANSRN